jgi:hypothetical protein
MTTKAQGPIAKGFGEEWEERREFVINGPSASASLPPLGAAVCASVRSSASFRSSRRLRCFGSRLTAFTSSAMRFGGFPSVLAHSPVSAVP